MKYVLALFVVAASLAGALGTASIDAAQLSATVIQTDTSDYAPGDSVIISGTGFWADETVRIDVSNLYNPGVGDTAQPWDVVADEMGAFQTVWIVPIEGVDQTYLVTAFGLNSQISASVTFTDCNVRMDFVTDLTDPYFCAGQQLTICAYLAQNCGNGVYAPLLNREILFFLNNGNCGVNQAQVSEDSAMTDVNGIACVTMTLPTTAGSYTIRLKFRGEDKPSSSQPPNSACDPNQRIALSSVNECEAIQVGNFGAAPTVSMPADFSVALCAPGPICMPVLLQDADCDIDTVYSNIGSYAGSVSMSDQIGRLKQLGGTITQVGGGQPGKNLLLATDFVPPVNTTSGVSVTLPNFLFASKVVNYGSFPSGTGPAQSADQMKGSPTDMTFTLPGAGGPDNGNGDGSVDFNSGNNVTLGFSQSITTCNGSNTDFIIFSNSNGGGTANLIFRRDGVNILSVTRTIPGGSAGSGAGGVTFDLPDGIKFNQVYIKCTSGTIEVDAIAARKLPSSSTTDLCFTADTTGVYRVIVTAVDDCGHVGKDTTLVTVSVNQPPVAGAGPDLTKFVCSFSQICFPVSFYDPNNNIKLTELIAGPGTLSGGQICFTPTTPGTSTFIIKVTDSCNLVDYDTASVTVGLNSAPVADNPSAIAEFLCASAELCHTFTATDANGGPLTWTKLSGPGTVTSGGVFCFTPIISGTFISTVIVSDSCGAKDTTSLTYSITINAPPIAANPTSPVALSLCGPQQVCYQFAATDQNGGTLVWSKISGEGSVTSAGQWCFTPSTGGSYSVSVAVTDSCGGADTTNLTYTITLNNPPTIAFANDTTVSQCSPQPICVGYTVADPDGLTGLMETMISGYGSIDTINNLICFTPTGAGTYKIIAGVTDPCTASDVDTVVVTVNVGAGPYIECPTAPISITLCSAPNQVCQAVAITPAGATVTASYGTYSSDQLCFTADTAGTYNILLTATTPCGTDNCLLTFNVTVSQPPNLTCPGPQTSFVCDAGESVCIPVGGAPIATWVVTPIGQYQSGNVCFNADTAGHYVIKVKATTPCGVDSCFVTADVTINSAPVAVDPVTPKDTFLCASQTICQPFSASDIDGGGLTWYKLSGSGSVSASGLWCFTPVTSGILTVTAKVTDSCGAADTVTMAYTVTINSAPDLAFGNDTTLFVCAPGNTCLPYTLTDPDNNIASIVLKAGLGNITLYPQQLCFTPLSSGLYTFIAEVTDSCGVKDRDTINITVQLNRLPVADAGNDTTVFHCAPAPVCWNAGATDLDGNLASVQLVSGPGTFDGSQICFTPTGTLNYEFVIKATDVCGAESYDTVVVYYTLNTAPVATAGPDSTLFQCAPAMICWAASSSDIDGNLTGSVLITGPGFFTGTQICFTPAASGSYTFILEAVDACGVKDRDTAIINVTLNSTPVCHVPNDTTIFVCSSSQICLPVSGTDVDNNLANCQIISGPGTLSGGQWCYTPISSQMVTVAVRCTDVCGAYCESQFTVDIKINSAPSIAFAAYNPFAICASQQICLDYTVSDPDDPQPRTVTLVEGSASLDTLNTEVCFTPATSGTYRFVIRVQDGCGSFDQDTIDVVVTLNSAPVANAGSDQTLYLCAPTQICWSAGCTDVDNNLLSCDLTGPGTYDGYSICFTPTASGTYVFTLTATDACGAQTADQVTINVTLNSPPTIALGNDTSLSLCQQQQICLPYSVGDPDGMNKLIEVLVSGYGAIDTALNKVCFTPTSSGSYVLIVGVTDSCGLHDEDTIQANVTFGEHASIVCPTGPISAFLCAAGQVCQQLTITPANATVTTSFGSYADGQLCFTADTSGTYNIKVIATASCQPPDTCDLTFNVTIGASPQISCPPPQTRFICEAGSLCIPVGVIGEGATVTVTPIGTYSAGNVCFPADSSGYYVLKVKATLPCGSDSCYVTVVVTINASPLAIDPQSPRDTFMCVPGQICHQFTGSDADGGTLTWNKVSGAGTVTAGGLWSFTPTAAGSYGVVVAVVDSCGKADTTTMTYNVAFNSPPLVTLGSLFTRRDTAVFLCDGAQLCVPYTASDPNNNLVLEELISAFGTIDTALNRVCFTPASAGLYPIIVKVTDGCGAYAADTLNVTVTFNRPPVVYAGDDDSQSMCTPTDVCWPITVTDEDNNVDSVKLIVGPGQIVTDQTGRSICFTPDTSGVYTFVVRVVDHCGASDQDTVVQTIHLNAPPVCQVPQGVNSFFQCAPAQISLPVSGTDPDGNFDHCEIVSGPGSIVGGQWVYTPSADETRKIIVQCVDQCGAFCRDSFAVQINLNAPPVAGAGLDATHFLCGSSQVCWPVTATDEDNNLKLVELISPDGTYNPITEQICFTPPYAEGQTRVYSFIVRATDSCNAIDYDTSVVTVKFNSPPAIHAPMDFSAYLEQLGELCFDAQVTDADDNITSVTVSPSGSYNQSTQQVCFTPTSTGHYCLVITATDACQKTAVDTVCIDVVIDQCIHVQIEKTHNVIQGMHNAVNVYLNGSGKQLGGFDFLIAYDPSALTPFGVTPGPLFTACGWEYFTYRFGAEGNCGSACPSGLLRIVGLAESNNGAYHPGCFFDGQIGSIAVIDFFVSNDRTLECQFSPVSFFWQSCADNSLSSRIGDTLWISRKVFDLELNNITNFMYNLPGYWGAPDYCLTNGGPGKPGPARCVDFTNGGVDIICADSIDARGDLNLNEVAYEVADAVMYSNYFVKGPIAFGNDIRRREAAIAASDCNADGIPLTVADLVYLIRVIVGDAPPMPKTAPNVRIEAQFNLAGGVLEISRTDVRIGAIFVVVEGDVQPELNAAASSMELKYQFDGKDTRILVSNMNGTSYLEAGPVLMLGGVQSVKSIEVGSYDGAVVVAKINSLPKQYSLSQNYPNPFNPMTTIEFALPVAGEWQLTVYNILGQQVETWRDRSEGGYYKITWDASRYSSGVYFYRLTAGDFKATKKMVLLK